MISPNRDAESPDPAQAELREISDGFLAQLERLSALEERKRETPVDDPAFPRLAAEVEATTRALLERAASQTAAAHEVHEGAVADGTSLTIEDIPQGTSATRIL